MEQQDDYFGNLMNYETPKESKEIAVATREEDIEQDFAVARANLQDLVEISQTSLTAMANLAKQMEHPKAYEALTKSITAAVLANKALLEIHKNRKEGKDENGDQPVQHITNNNLFLTTAEMMEKLQEAREQLDAPK